MRSKILFVLLLWPSLAFGNDWISQINSYRASHGQTKVLEDSKLTNAAVQHAKFMAQTSSLTHDGWQSRVGGYNRGGENVAFGHGDFPATLKQWINSSGHNRILLMPAANIVGLGSFYNPETKRTYWAMEIAVKSSERKTVRYEKEKERKPARYEKEKTTPTKSKSILSLLPSWLKF
jgi:cysteine-rich secretory family protein